MSKPLMIFCSDLHLSAKPPVARAGEEDWYEAMRRSLRELSALATEYDVPVVCAGDVFDHWRSPPELINFALAELPDMYVVAGQHDLPYHQWSELHKSALWTLVKAGKVEMLGPGEPTDISGVEVWGFSWGHEVEPPTRGVGLKVAVIHEYTWIPGAGYNKAPLEAQASKGKYKGFNLAVIGDNHIAWEAKLGKTQVFNVGGFMRRRADEGAHAPRVGVLWDDDIIRPHVLDSKDVLAVSDFFATKQEDEDIQRFVSELIELRAVSLDYPEALRRALNESEVSASVRRVVEKALED